ncbi:hypothetical protein ACLOJK_001473 [Asimina triloba]
MTTRNAGKVRKLLPQAMILAVGLETESSNLHFFWPRLMKGKASYERLESLVGAWRDGRRAPVDDRNLEKAFRLVSSGGGGGCRKPTALFTGPREIWPNLIQSRARDMKAIQNI